MRTDKNWIIIGIILILLGTVQATSSDGNYVLLQTDFAGSGDNTTDGNYTLFTDIGETTTQQHSTDNNYNTGTGFWGEAFIAPFAALAAIYNIFFVEMPSRNNIIIPMIMLAAIIAGVGLYVVFKRKAEDEDDEDDDEYLSNEKQETEN